MRILMLSNVPLIESQGSGYIVLNTAKSFDKLGHNVEVIPPSSFSVFSALKNRANNYRMALGMAKWVLNNAKKIKRNELLIFYGAESFIAIFFIKNILKLNVKIILHSNGLESHVTFRLKHFKSFLTENTRWYHVNLDSLYKYCYKNVDCLITLSKYDREFAISHLHLKPEKIFYLEPSLPDGIVKVLDDDITSEQSIITFCGSWIDRKGIRAISEAIPDVLIAHPKYIFRLIGVGEGFQPADHFPSDILPRIEVFPLIQDKEKLVRLYEETSIFLFPSLCESFGLVIVEAMSCGCAVITGPTGFAASLKNYKEALVLDNPNGHNVKISLEELITNDALRHQLQIQGKERVKGLIWANYRENLKRILNNIDFKRGT